MTVLKVSKVSNPHAVAGAIAGIVRDHGLAVMQSIGAGATNQAVKAIAIARSFMKPEGVDLHCSPAFVDVEFNGETRTALRFEIFDLNVPRVVSDSGATVSEDATNATASEIRTFDDEVGAVQSG